jgi:predicted glycosyltransferase
MRIWIDLGNSPHVPFFSALSRELSSRGHDILWTARDYAQTVELAAEAGIDATVFGKHGGKHLVNKGAEFASRVWNLTRWARGRSIDLVLSHNSQEPLVVARLLGLDSVNMMDYEHHPGNHLAFRTAKRLLVPNCFPAASLRRFGASEKKVRRYNGIKEDVYLADFVPDPNFHEVLYKFGVERDDVLVVIRPHAPDALYHRGIANRLLSEALLFLSADPGCKVILLPRKPEQGQQLREENTNADIIIPDKALDGANLIAAADLVISGGGTMNREAAALGVPAATIFAGEPAAVDQYLISEDRMSMITSAEDLEHLRVVKKGERKPRAENDVRAQIADLILEVDRSLVE